MAEEASLIDAVKLLAKAAKEKPDETSSVVRGALHEDQIDAVRVVLSKARDGSLIHLVAPQGSAATPAAASTDDPGVLHLRATSVQRRAWTAKGTPNKVPAKFQGAAPPANTRDNYPPLPAAAPTTWRQTDRARSRPRTSSRRDQTPHPAIFATPEEVAAMSPNSRLIYDTQMSLHRQEEQEEATTGGASASTATMPRRPPWAEAWQPDSLPLQELRRPATPSARGAPQGADRPAGDLPHGHWCRKGRRYWGLTRAMISPGPQASAWGCIAWEYFPTPLPFPWPGPRSAPGGFSLSGTLRQLMSARPCSSTKIAERGTPAGNFLASLRSLEVARSPAPASLPGSSYGPRRVHPGDGVDNLPGGPHWKGPIRYLQQHL